MPEAASIAPEITKRIVAFNRKLEKLLAARIQRGIRDGDVARQVDAGAAARLLLAAQTGLMVLAARERRPANVTRATIREALRLLERFARIVRHWTREGDYTTPRVRDAAASAAFEKHGIRVSDLY